MTARVLIVVNSPGSGPRRLEGWLRDAGVEPHIVAGADGLPDTLDGYAGLVLLGGGFMPDDLECAPWLVTERALASAAIASDLPTLGICLGAQVLADVAGGGVRASWGVPERGATTVWVTDAGASDPVIAALAPDVAVIENHRDQIVALPPEAVLLASSEHCAVQAFRFGAHVRGVQFHPEASADDIAGWDDAALREGGLDRDALVAAARGSARETDAACAAIVRAFADEVLARAE